MGHRVRSAGGKAGEAQTTPSGLPSRRPCRVAQLAERRTHNAEDAGSIPVPATQETGRCHLVVAVGHHKVTWFDPRPGDDARVGIHADVGELVPLLPSKQALRHCGFESRRPLGRSAVEPLTTTRPLRFLVVPRFSGEENPARCGASGCGVRVSTRTLGVFGPVSSTGFPTIGAWGVETAGRGHPHLDPP